MSLEYSEKWGFRTGMGAARLLPIGLCCPGLVFFENPGLAG